MKSSAAVHPDEHALRAFALTFPEAHEDHPWGESAFKVKGKVFLFVYVHAQGLNASMKLPLSNERALAMPFAEPTGYGLGKSGWVTCKFDAYERVPMETMKSWIVESYRAVAPKKLAATLAIAPDGSASATSDAASKPAIGRSPRRAQDGAAKPPRAKAKPKTGRPSVTARDARDAHDAARSRRVSKLPAASTKPAPSTKRRAPKRATRKTT